MLQAERLKRALEALRVTVQQAAEADPALRAALVGTSVEELMAEITSAMESESFPHHGALALRVFEEIGLPEEQPELMGQIIRGIGRAHERLGNTSEAYEAYQRALNLAEGAKDDALAAGCLRRMGRVMMNMAQWDSASELLGKSDAIYQRIEDRNGHAEALCDIGSLHFQKGELSDAEKAYKQALEAAEELEDVTLIINLKSNLGIIANVRGDVANAIEQYQGCAALANQAQKEPLLAQAYHNLGMAYADRREWSNACECYEKALELARKHGLASIVGTAHLNKAEMYLELGDLTMASVDCGRALSMFKTTRDSLSEAEVYRVLGDVFARRGNEVVALKMFNQCLEMTKIANAPLETAETYRAMGEAYERLGHTQQAISALEHALRYFGQVEARGDYEATEKLLARLRSSA